MIALHQNSLHRVQYTHTAFYSKQDLLKPHKYGDFLPRLFARGSGLGCQIRFTTHCTTLDSTIYNNDHTHTVNQDNMS